MDIRRITSQQAASSALRALGLGDAGIDLSEPEALAESLRRASSFLCPAPRRRIVKAVSEALAGLPGSDDRTGAALEEMLAALIGYGDLLELPSGSGGRQVFLGPPAFVPRTSGACLVMGVRPDGAALLGGELGGLIIYESHVRLVGPTSPEKSADQLTAAGLTELTAEQWLQPPPEALPEQLAAGYKRHLGAARPSGEITGFRLIDPSAPVTYYPGRWRAPAGGDSGCYVGRRPQAYGADLWCFAAISGGRLDRVIDLPVGMSAAPAADEAWRLQAALDAMAGRPQRFRVAAGSR
ncbi:MAG: hypothetical protein M3Y33_15335, partial [Actinomycetota bacterium]|nr:hypothetical protein [Actinomycetota bacterium]